MPGLFLASWMGKCSQCSVIGFSLLFFLDEAIYLVVSTQCLFQPCLIVVHLSYPTLNIELNKNYTSVQFLASAVVITDLRLVSTAFGGVSRCIRESLLCFHAKREILVNQEQERALFWGQPWIIMFASAISFAEHAAASWREAVCAALIKDRDGASDAVAVLSCVVP